MTDPLNCPKYFGDRQMYIVTCSECNHGFSRYTSEEARESWNKAASNAPMVRA